MRILFCLAAFLLPLCGFSACLALLAEVYTMEFLGVHAAGWFSLALILLIGSVVSLFFSLQQEKVPVGPPPPSSPIVPETDKFMKECKLAMRGHLKLSIIFWILAYRKEKVKSFEDARKEVLTEIKKEIPHVRWVDTILKEIQEELGKASK